MHIKTGERPPSSGHEAITRRETNDGQSGTQGFIPNPVIGRVTTVGYV